MICVCPRFSETDPVPSYPVIPSTLYSRPRTGAQVLTSVSACPRGTGDPCCVHCPLASGHHCFSLQKSCDHVKSCPEFVFFCRKHRGFREIKTDEQNEDFGARWCGRWHSDARVGSSLRTESQKKRREKGKLRARGSAPAATPPLQSSFASTLTAETTGNNQFLAVRNSCIKLSTNMCLGELSPVLHTLFP